MKAPIKIDQRCAGDYLASIASICSAADAEFYLVLADSDRIENDPELGLTVTRKGRTYTQVTKMDTFGEMAFDEHTMVRYGQTIIAKLIEA